MREAIHALKYDHLHGAAKRLGQMLAEAIAQLAAEAPAEMLVVPVPLHRTKHAEPARWPSALSPRWPRRIQSGG